MNNIENYSLYLKSNYAFFYIKYVIILKKFHKE